MGILTPGFFDRSYASFPVHLLPLRQDDSRQEPICEIMNFATACDRTVYSRPTKPEGFRNFSCRPVSSLVMRPAVTQTNSATSVSAVRDEIKHDSVIRVRASPRPAIKPWADSTRTLRLCHYHARSCSTRPSKLLLI